MKNTITLDQARRIVWNGGTVTAYTPDGKMRRKGIRINDRGEMVYSNGLPVYAEYFRFTCNDRPALSSIELSHIAKRQKLSIHFYVRYKNHAMIIARRVIDKPIMIRDSELCLWEVCPAMAFVVKDAMRLAAVIDVNIFAATRLT